MITQKDIKGKTIYFHFIRMDIRTFKETTFIFETSFVNELLSQIIVLCLASHVNLLMKTVY